MAKRGALQFMSLDSMIGQGKGMLSAFANTRDMAVKSTMAVVSALSRDRAEARSGSHASILASVRTFKLKTNDALGRATRRILDECYSGIAAEVKKAGGIERVSRGLYASYLGKAQAQLRKAAEQFGGVSQKLVEQNAQALGELSEAVRRRGLAGVTSAVKKLESKAFSSDVSSTLVREGQDIQKHIADVIKGKAKLSTKLKEELRKISNNLNSNLGAAKNDQERIGALTAAKNSVASLTATHAKDPAAQKVLKVLQAVMDEKATSANTLVKDKNSQRVAMKMSNTMQTLSKGLGRVASVLGVGVKAIETGIGVWQTVNRTVNAFGRQQMAIQSERGGYGRMIRGAGVNPQHMMTAIAAGRTAGMDDATVISQTVSFAQRLAQARWGEGGLPEQLGRWGGTPYGAGGSPMNVDELYREISRIFRSLGSEVEKTQFLADMNIAPDQREMIENYEKIQARKKRSRGNKRLQGTLEEAEILDESGFSAKADAATKIELRRREILNQNALQQGPRAAFKRFLSPDNWLFSDWTARQRGAREAQSQIAMDKLTKAIIEQTELERQGKPTDPHLLDSLTNEIRALAHLGEGDKANREGKSHFYDIDRMFEESTGIRGDDTSGLEKVIKKLEIILDKLADQLIEFFNKISKTPIAQKAASFIERNPLGAAAIGVGAFLLRKPIVRAASKVISPIVRYAGSGLKKFIGAGKAATPSETGSLLKGGKEVANAVGVGKEEIGKAVGSSAGAASAMPASNVVLNGELAANQAVQTLNKKWGLNLKPNGTPSSSASPNVVRPSEWNSAVEEVNKLSQAGGGGVSKSGAQAVAQGASLVGKGSAAKSGGRFGKIFRPATKLARGGASKIPAIGTLLTLGFGGYDAYQGYSAGDTKAGNRAIGDTGGFLTGMGIGASIGSAIFPIIGTAIGGTIGGFAGGFLGEKVADVISEWLAVQGSDANKKQEEQKREAEANETKEGKPFIEVIRDHIRKGEVVKAQSLLEEKHIGGISSAALKSDDFMHSDSGAKELLRGAFKATLKRDFAKRYGKDLDLVEDYHADKYIAALDEAGIEATREEMLEAYARLQAGSKEVSGRVLENYTNLKGRDSLEDEDEDDTIEDVAKPQKRRDNGRTGLYEEEKSLSTQFADLKAQGDAYKKSWGKTKDKDKSKTKKGREPHKKSLSSTHKASNKKKRITTAEGSNGIIEGGNGENPTSISEIVQAGKDTPSAIATAGEKVRKAEQAAASGSAKLKEKAGGGGEEGGKQVIVDKITVNQTYNFGHQEGTPEAIGDAGRDGAKRGVAEAIAIAAPSQSTY